MKEKTVSLTWCAISLFLFAAILLSGSIAWAAENLVAKEIIQINTKEELITLLNREFPVNTGIPADPKRYGILDSTVYLNADLEISSDDINSQFPENTQYTNYEHSFMLDNSSFIGNGHTITITQGTRKIYSLFGNIRLSGTTDTGYLSRIENLSLVYKGDVYGAGFARTVTQAWADRTNYRFDQINITVEGNILPVTVRFWTQNLNSDNTVATAVGFADFVDGKGATY